MYHSLNVNVMNSITVRSELSFTFRLGMQPKVCFVHIWAHCATEEYVADQQHIQLFVNIGLIN